jgi:hypothetical protein
MHKVEIHVRFELGEIVYLRHEKKKLPGMISAWLVREGSVVYWVSWADDRTEKEHQAIELTSEFVEEYDPTDEQ